MERRQPPVSVGPQSRDEAEESQDGGDPDHRELHGHRGHGLADGAARRIAGAPDRALTGRAHVQPDDDQADRQSAGDEALPAERIRGALVERCPQGGDEPRRRQDDGGEQERGDAVGLGQPESRGSESRRRQEQTGRSGSGAGAVDRHQCADGCQECGKQRDGQEVGVEHAPVQQDEGEDGEAAGHDCGGEQGRGAPVEEDVRQCQAAGGPHQARHGEHRRVGGHGDARCAAQLHGQGDQRVPAERVDAALRGLQEEAERGRVIGLEDPFHGVEVEDRVEGLRDGIGGVQDASDGEPGGGCRQGPRRAPDGDGAEAGAQAGGS